MQLGFFDFCKMAYRVIAFKVEQKKLETNETAIVETQLGSVRGVKRRTIWRDEYFSFEKIPFAKPPVGELRFRAPVPVEPWTTVLDCSSPADKPIQTTTVFADEKPIPLLGKFQGSEDCLYLNVYSKNLAPENLRPVMVWIYGGGFQMGEASRDFYGPDLFLSKDIVFVSIAYRLGPFGFLNLDDPEVNIPGNAGLKDQLLGLKWVKDHIAAFGGDPNNITLFGESAGGASTHFCMISEKSKGLINKAIVMSGSALCPWACLPRTDNAYRLAKHMGYEGSKKDKDVCKFLVEANAPDIMKALKGVMTKEEKHNRVVFMFTPVIEPYVTDQCVIPRDPYELMKETWSNQIPMMIGGTSFEGLLFLADFKRNRSLFDDEGNCKNILPHDVNFTPEEAEACGRRLKDTHFGKGKSHSKETMNFVDMESYREFWHPMTRTIRSRISANAAPTYIYRFDYDSRDGNMIRNILCGRGVRGACHGDDMCYLFHSLFAYRASKDSDEYKMARSMIDIWTSFATTSDPNCRSLGDEIFPPQDRASELHCLNINQKPEYMPLPELTKLNVWDSFYPADQL